MTASVVQPRSRLHPLTPVLKGAKFLAVWIAAISWQGFSSAGPVASLVMVVAALVLSLVGALVSWLATGYEVAGRELRVYEGLLFRRTRSIPLERVQAIDVVRPLLARLAGLSELRLEVVGGKEAEGRLAYLSAAEAAHLRERLLALASTTREPHRDLRRERHHDIHGDIHSEIHRKTASPDGRQPLDGAASTGAGGLGGTPDVAATSVRTRAPAVASVVERPIHVVANREVLISQLLTPAALLFPFLATGSLLQWYISADANGWSLVTSGSLLTTIVGIVAMPVRRVVDEWRWRIGTDPAGLRLRHGLLETRSQTVPPRRIQAVSILRPLFWRPMGWRRTKIDVAGYGAEPNVNTGLLLPVADERTTRLIGGWALTGALTGTFPESTGPEPTDVSSTDRGSADRETADHGSAGFDLDVDRLPLVPPPRRARWLAPLARSILGFGYTDEFVTSRDGLLSRRVVVVPLSRIQSVRVVQGPLQRRLGLASLHVDTAGGLHAVGEHRDAREAYAHAATLADLSRAARRAA